jgi:hypothetical protein
LRERGREREWRLRRTQRHRGNLKEGFVKSTQSVVVKREHPCNPWSKKDKKPGGMYPPGFESPN